MRSLVSSWSALLALAALSAACGSTTATRTGANYPAREAACDFELLTTSPAAGFEEIGTVDVSRGAYATNVYTDLSSFGDHIRPNVCEMGGDALVATQTGFGAYTKATVFKKTDQGARVGDASASTGCQVDTQCKGERVCVAGACVDPVRT
jgi:hypothetical protein